VSRKPSEVRYRVITADPPWSFGDKLPGPGRGAEKHYSVMPTDDICAFPLPPVEDDSLLFLWRVSAMQEEALRVVRAWGFVPKSEIVWVKTSGSKSVDFERVTRDHVSALLSMRQPPEDVISNFAEDMRRCKEPNLAFGMGRYVRASHETCLVCARGKAAALVRDHSVRSVFFAPRQEHSRKPEEFYSIVERLAPGPYVELFARHRRPGWTQFGDELGSL
jgi:N6-adenosine-specific RNA methylase IME4